MLDMCCTCTSPKNAGVSHITIAWLGSRCGECCMWYGRNSLFFVQNGFIEKAMARGGAHAQNAIH